MLRYLMETWLIYTRQVSLPRMMTRLWMAGHETTSWRLKLTGTWWLKLKAVASARALSMQKHKLHLQHVWLHAAFCMQS